MNPLTLPAALALFAATALLQTSCANPNPKSQYHASRLTDARAVPNDRPYEIRAEGWDTPPPYAQFTE